MMAKAIALWDEDAVSAAIGQAQAWSIGEGLPSAGVALVSTPAQREARAQAVIQAIEAYRAEMEAKKNEGTAGGANVPPSNVPSGSPGGASGPGASPEGGVVSGDAKSGGAPAEEPKPKSRIPAREPRSMAVELVLGSSGLSADDVLLRALGVEPGAGEGELREMNGRQVRSITAAGWVRPLLVSQSAGRLVLASDERAMQFALDDNSGDGDALGGDWVAHRQLVNEAHKSVRPAASVLLNFNAIRRELGIEWEASFGYRLLTTWRMPNVRSISLHAGLADSGAKDKLPTLLVLDAAWSAKSDAPGQGMMASITEAAMPRLKASMNIPNADVIAVASPQYGSLVDWAFHTFIADVASDMTRGNKMYIDWRLWLFDHRTVLTRTADAFGRWTYFGIKGLNDRSSDAAVHWRTEVRSGYSPELMLKNVETLTGIVGVGVSEALEPMVWSVPVDASWLKGAVNWTTSKVFGANILMGTLTLDSADGVTKLYEAARSADQGPPPTRVPEPKRTK